MTEVVNFGKYRGQPIEVLASDRGYCDWLMAQPWFRDRYQNLYTVIINNFQQPAETPDHNALQVLFLDPKYCEAVVRLAMGNRLDRLWYRFLDDRTRVRQKLRDEIDLARANMEKEREREAAEGECRWRTSAAGHEITLNKLTAELVDSDRPEFMVVKARPVFEQHAIDVLLNVSVRSTYGADSWSARFSNEVADFEVGIEIKPTVGDDYPAVLRQMRREVVSILFLEQYTGVGATEQQMRQIFGAAGKLVVFRHEVDAELAGEVDHEAP
jgi:hypothetical protein